MRFQLFTLTVFSSATRRELPRESIEQEEDNCRFDCLQDLEDPTKFLLVEIYKTAAGPTAHKATPHYNAWRETVGDMMAAPRAAAKYVPVYPWAGLWGTGAAARRGKGRGQGEKQAGAGGVAGAVGDVEGGRDDDAPEEKGEALAGHFLSLASEGASKDGGGDDASVNAVDSAGGGGGSAAGEDKDTKVITHVHVTVKPGKEDEFIECTIANAASSVLEPDNLRFDVLRNAARPAEFLLVEVYATAEGPAAHKNTPHYRCWRDDVEELMAAPREAKRYAARFPVEPSAWKMILSEE